VKFGKPLHRSHGGGSGNVSKFQRRQRDRRLALRRGTLSSFLNAAKALSESVQSAPWLVNSRVDRDDALLRRQ